MTINVVSCKKKSVIILFTGNYIILLLLSATLLSIIILIISKGEPRFFDSSKFKLMGREGRHRDMLVFFYFHIKLRMVFIICSILLMMRIGCFITIFVLIRLLLHT